MQSIERVEEILRKINTAKLSVILPSILPLALECKDYQGYALLAHWNCPICENTRANAIQRNEIMRNLMFHGLTQEQAKSIELLAANDYIDMRTVTDKEMLTHSVNEIETWFLGYEEVYADTVKSGDRDGLRQLENRKIQLKQQYELLRSVIISKVTYYKQVLMQENVPNSDVLSRNCTSNFKYNKVFVVHGHNGEMKEAVARLIEKQGIQAIILHEQANQGATIIEKFEKNSDVGGAVCLFTADDLGHAKTETENKKRARQNVVFEAGYFIGKLGRKNVIIISDKDVEIPSDLQGVVYVESNSWQFSVLKELKAMGYSIDYNKLD